MAIAFPASPVSNQIYTVGSKSWQWDGNKWLGYYNEAPDAVYGSAFHGSVDLDGSVGNKVLDDGSEIQWNFIDYVYTITTDIYLHDLTIGENIRLNTNGYRVFVRNALILNSGSKIGFLSGFSTTGSIAQGGAATTAVTHSLGGSATGYTATAPTAAMGGTQYFKNARQAITGYSITASGGPTFLRGGAGGSGQAGGGVVIVAARYIYGPSSGTASIQAPATAPAGGGVVIVVSAANSLPASVTTNVSGQNPGTSIYIQQI